MIIGIFLLPVHDAVENNLTENIGELMENLRQGKIRLTQRFPCSQETDTGDAWQPAILSGFWFFSVEPILVKLSVSVRTL